MLGLALNIGVGDGGGPLWTPKSLPGLALWLDAGQAGGVDGNNLTSWPDLSENNFHLNAQDAANVFHASGGPNNKPYIAFSLGALYRASPLIVGADAPRTCYTVVRRGADSHIAWLDGRWGYNGFGFGFGIGTSGKREVLICVVADRYDTTAVATGNWEQIGIVNTGAADQAMRVGGATHALSGVGAGVVSSTLRFSVGGNDNAFQPSAFVGDIAEIIITSGVVSDPIRASIEAYLTAKYGV